MCGRFYLTTPTGALAELFQLPSAIAMSGRSVAQPPQELHPRYNIAPGSSVAIIRTALSVSALVGPELGSHRELAHARWGLIPGWASVPDVGVQTINCRAEAAERSPSVYEALCSRRCLVPADGFFEWRTMRGGEKCPMLFRVRSDSTRPYPTTFAMAGVYGAWVPNDGGAMIESCAVLTTHANRVMSDIHDRMPAILRPRDYEAWLGDGQPANGDEIRRLKDLCRPYPDELMSAIAVSPLVNSPRHDDPRCLQPVDAGPNA